LPEPDVVPPISHDDLVRGLRGRDFTLVDVLPAVSFAEGHIPGAVSLPLAELAHLAPTRLSDLDQPVVVYCGGDT
jgi:rhodanese-related sulfurtransferase